MAIIKLSCRRCNKYVDESRFHHAHGLLGKKFQYTYIQCFDYRDKLMAEESVPVPILNRYEILDLRGH